MENGIRKYDGCRYRNRNGTNRLIDVKRGHKSFYRSVKLKYLKDQQNLELWEQYLSLLRSSIYTYLADRFGEETLLCEENIKLHMDQMGAEDGALSADVNLRIKDVDGCGHTKSVYIHDYTEIEKEKIDRVVTQCFFYMK